MYGKLKKIFDLRCCEKNDYKFNHISNVNTDKNSVKVVVRMTRKGVNLQEKIFNKLNKNYFVEMTRICKIV